MDRIQTERRVAALLMGGAAVVNLGVGPRHLQDWWAAGAFLLWVAVLQGVWAVMTWRRRSPRWLLALGQVLGVAVLGVWLASRTTGLPIGPDRWTPQPVGAADLVCGTLELAAVLVLAAARLRLRAPATVLAPTRVFDPPGPGRSPAASGMQGEGAWWAPSGAASTTTLIIPVRRRSRGVLVTAAVAVGVVAAAGVALAAPAPQDTQPEGTAGAGSTPSPGGGTATTGNGKAKQKLENLPDDSAATADQKASARALVVALEADTAAYRDVAKAKAAGFDVQAAWQKRQTTMTKPAATAGPKRAAASLVQVVNTAHLTDGQVLDPKAPEALVYSHADNGTFALVGVMFTSERKQPSTSYQPYLRWRTVKRVGATTHVWFVSSDDLRHAYAVRPPAAALAAYAATRAPSTT